MVWGTTGYSYRGTDLKTLAYHVSVFSDQRPRVTGQAVGYTGEHGVRISGRRYLGPRQFTVGMVLLPQNTSGNITTSELEHAQENAETLERLFWLSEGLGTFQKTMPDGDVRTIEARVEGLQRQRNRSGILSRMAVQMFAPYPIWAGSTESYLARTGSFSVVNDGTLPAADLTISFTNAGTLTNSRNGAEIVTSGAVDIDVKNGVATVSGNPAENLVEFNEEYWFEIEPGTNNLTETGAGSVDVVFKHGWD